MLLFLLVRCLDERPQCFRAGRAVGPRQRKQEKLLFDIIFPHIPLAEGTYLREKGENSSSFVRGRFYEEAFCFYFSGFASCAFHRETATALGFLVKCLSSLLSSTYTISMRKVCGLELAWGALISAYGQVVLFFIRVTFRITSDERNPQGSCSQRGYHMLWIRAL